MDALGDAQGLLSTAEEIRSWLIVRISERFDMDPRSIDIRERFSRYGLDSLGAAALVADLGAALGRAVASTVIWRYPTIESLARYLTVGASLLPERPIEQRTRVSAEEPIAIIGVGCRFPKSPSPEAFWRTMRDGVDAITEVPADRWDIEAFYDADLSVPGKMNTRWGGFLEGLDQFDASFFDISSREAIYMDPQQRLMLEISWEALEDAGIAPKGLQNSRTGVFFGAVWSDYARGPRGAAAAIAQYTLTGHDLCVIPGRVSYALGLKGPSLAVNTGCSSSLLAVHLACQSLYRGESDLALAGGVNLILAPESTIELSKLGAMAPDGRSKVFDARANGYVRGEGGGVVVLKPLSRALAAGDPIYCVIRGGAVNNDGFSNGLTAPNPKAQEEMLREAYSRAGVDPLDVQYVEAHGTGTVLGDPIEANALGAVLCVGRPVDRPLRVGSVKTNIGHAEAAAGIAGLIKVALAMRHLEIPPSLHFMEPNPNIPFEDLRIKVQRSLEPWPAEEGRMNAGVSSFGIGGTNCHVVLEGFAPSPVHLFPLSAGSADALSALARRVSEVVAAERPEVPLPELCSAAAARLSHDECRLALTVESCDALLTHLASFCEGRTSPGMSSGRATDRTKVAFMFGGQGSQWVGMGQDLLREEPVFRSALLRCEETMRRYVDWSLMEELTAIGPQSLERTDIVQPAIFAMQVALAALWRSLGIEPDAVVGQSMGEVAAAHVAGALSLEDAARIICRRSQIVRKASGKGGMAVAELSLRDAQRALAGYEDRLSVAVSASPQSTVLSGDLSALGEVLERIRAQGVFCQLVNVDYASHSPQMDPLLTDVWIELDGIQPQSCATPFYSTVTGATLDGKRFGAAYWVRNLREPVLFSSAVEGLLNDGYEVFLDVNPHPLLMHAVEQILSHHGRRAIVLPSQRRGEASRAILLPSLGALYAAGRQVRWSRLYPIGVEPAPTPSIVGVDWSAPEAAARITRAGESMPSELFVISGRSREALRAKALSMSSWLMGRRDLSLQDVCYTASVRRSHHEHRICAVVRSIQELQESLAAFLRGESPPGVVESEAPALARPKVVFVFPDQGSEWAGMGRRLLLQEPVFRAAIEACERAIQGEAKWSVLDELSSEESQSRLGRPNVAQAALFAVEVALAALWRSFGVEPDAVVGQGLGDVAAAHVAGVLALADAAQVVCGRGVLADEQRAAPEGFSQRVQRLFDEGHTVFIEISPHPILVPAIEEVMREAPRRGLALSSMRRHQEERSVLLESLALLYAHGYPVAFERLYSSGGRCVPLPTYSWQRRRYWLETE